MSYTLKYTDDAEKDIERLKRSGNKQALKKLKVLLLEIIEHPRTGTGQVEQLKHFKEEIWSRRINSEHRLVYQIEDDIIAVLVLSAYGHYK
ncbi:Txe/YoeB family addiction module toxin [Bacteroides clarus]|uniref:Putative mRNA interferase YoeB n=1 Tax=Bacteroides clarus TaxID=626929 RepID=A0A412Y8X1_9BACE|nr:Txe/YoeB family addiction module toxin [Bacteroides clarus]RGV37024.1 Txe/YoeB family addiction module toxin [Bacteroides clarus]RGV53865.1 Txe/YoeB family addiction module toxin [Bacteroides clarus]